MKSEILVLFLLFSAVLLAGCIGEDNTDVEVTSTTFAESGGEEAEDIDVAFIEEDETVEIGDMI